MTLAGAIKSAAERSVRELWAYTETREFEQRNVFGIGHTFIQLYFGAQFQGLDGTLAARFPLALHAHNAVFHGTLSSKCLEHSVS